MKHKRKKGRLLRVVGITLTVLLILAGVELLYSNASVAVSRYSVSSEKIRGSFRVVFLSDLHGREFGLDNFRLLNKIAAQEPDLIALVGDIIDNDADEEQIETMCSFIRGAAAIAPVYYGIGNHEHAHHGFRKDGAFDAHQSPLARRIEAAGAHIVDCEYLDTEINGNPIRIGGYMGYYRQPGMFPGSEEQWLAELAFADAFEDTDRFKLLLDHIPTGWIDWNYKNNYPVDLVLSGHYHGGVVRIPILEQGLFAPYVGWFPPNTRGLFTGKEATCILTTGLAGSYGYPRFFNAPEICVVDIAPVE